MGDILDGLRQTQKKKEKKRKEKATTKKSTPVNRVSLIHQMSGSVYMTTARSDGSRCNSKQGVLYFGNTDALANTIIFGKH